MFYLSHFHKTKTFHLAVNIKGVLHEVYEHN
jgi:hypothetical protein